MENSHIEWTTHTFNPWHGCAKVSPGCKNCYAEGQHNFHYSSLKAQQGTCWGVGSPRLATSADNWKKPLKWNREAQAAGTRPRVFCASMADVFEEQSELSRSFAGETAQVPSGPGKTRTVRFVDIAAERLRLLRLIYDTPHLDWLLLTKRPEHIETALYDAYCANLKTLGPDSGITLSKEETSARIGLNNWLAAWCDHKAPANVWLGTSVENQEQADARIPHLLAAPAAVRFLSCEPLLGPVSIRQWLWRKETVAKFPEHAKQRINWVIVGGESGPKARPMHPDWARSLRNQCETTGVAFHFKQWGEYQPFYPSEPKPAGSDANWHNWPGGVVSVRMGKHAAGRLLGGCTWDELPSVSTLVPAKPKLKLTPYRELKDKLVGTPGTPERIQFDQELADELAGLTP